MEQKIFSFRTLSYLPTEELWNYLFEKCETLFYPDGTIIVEQGSRLQNLFFIKSGGCKLTAEVDNVRTKKKELLLLRSLSCNSIFGAENFVLGGESMYNVIANGETTILMLHPQSLDSIKSSDLEFFGGFMKYLACSLYEMLHTLSLPEDIVRFYN